MSAYTEEAATPRMAYVVSSKLAARLIRSVRLSW